MDLQEIDNNVAPGGLPGHEMSSDQVYLNLPNEISQQKNVRGTSCWGTFEYLFEKEFNGIKANIVKPSERDPALLTNALYFRGPYLNVKDKVTVTVVDESTNAVVKMLQFLTYENGQYDIIQGGRNARVMKQNGKTIDQGFISSLDGGRLRGLGLNDGDVISASQAGFAGSRVFDSSSPQDPFLITLERLTADNSNPASRSESIPLAIVNTVAFSSTGALNYAHYSNSSKPVFNKISIPSLKSPFSFGASTVALPTEALSSGNTFELEGKDGSGVPFIHGISYQYLKGGELQNKKAVLNEGGDQFVPSQATPISLKKFILASSDFPPLLTGIPGQSKTVSQVVSVDAFPNKVFADTLFLN